MRWRGAWLAVALTLTGGIVSGAGEARAQSFARRVVPRGEVTGLEMGIEGSLSAIRGGHVRWFVSLYEVLRRRDLRVSPGSTLEVTASFAPDEPIATVRTDARGRAAIELPIPDEVEEPLDVRVAATSERGVRRVFSVTLSVLPRYEVTLFTDRDDPAPGSTVAVFGRVLDRVDGGPAEGTRVTVHARSTGPLIAPRALTTDRSGVFSTRVEVGDQPGAVHLEAKTESGAARSEVTVSTVAPPLMWVVASPESPVARPGEAVPVAVRVRRADGSPVRGAQVRFADAPDDDDRPHPRTDAEGRARLSFRAPRVIDGEIEERTRNIVVVHPGIGSMEASVGIRVARTPILAAFAVEGGALVPGIPGRVFARVVTPDGEPVASRSVSLEAPRLGGLVSATTDADGVAVFAGTPSVGGGDPSCGGPTAMRATLIVDGHRRRHCLPVDPDAEVAVRVDDVLVTGPVEVRVERRPSVRSAPVEVTALARREGTFVPVARVVVAGGADRATLTPPSGAGRELWLRARPVLADGRAIRGGGIVVYRRVAGGEAFSLSADDAGVRTVGGRPGTTAVFAVRARRKTALERQVEGAAGPIALAFARGRSDDAVRALLASRTPTDDAATAVRRDGLVVPQPLPADPVAHGLLRDPHRTRARFVRGRLGRLMRAVEEYASAQIPDRIEEVAVREGGRWRFNHAVLLAATSQAGLSDEMVAALDGEPLDIEGLMQMDRAFSFDNVARRITRERLWRVVVMLREHVRSHELDRPWARRGDPAEYLNTLLSGNTSFQLAWPERSDLFDAWGTPLALRRARGGRARFTFLEPVPGWELVSAGPDGRVGTGDDLADPFARILPSSGIYAEAVGEDVLLSRLRGVAVGRATVESLASVFEVDIPTDGSQLETSAVETWHALPSPPTPSDEEARLSPIEGPIGGVGPDPAWELPRERRRYAAVAIRFARDGSLESARDELEAGVPWAVRLALPTAMRPGERLRVPVELVQLADAPRPTIEAAARGGALEARLVGRELTLRARRPGIARVTVRIRLGEGRVESISRRVRVVPAGSLFARHSGTVAASEAELSITAPEDAVPWRARLVVGAPRSLHRDPLFEEILDRHPSILGWAEMSRAGSVDEEILARVTRAYESGRSTDELSVACALPSWASREDAREATPLLEATRALAEGVSEDLETRAAILAALAAFAPSASAGGADGLARLLAALRLDGWRALAAAPDRPSVMARMAAALLLVDRRDAAGRALLARARDSLEEDASGRRWLPANDGGVGDSFVGTLALAIAARQVGADALADELGRSALGRMYLVERLGAQGAFWAVAASSYGAFGVDAPSSFDLELGGGSRRVDLVDGVAVVPVVPGARARVRAASRFWVRTESRFVVAARQAEGSPLRAHLEGGPGRFGGRSAFELVVQNEGDSGSPTPVVELTLPGAAVLDDVARRAIARAPGVAEVGEPDGAGVVRLRLEPLVEDGTLRIPLPLSWIARGRALGLSMRLYDAASPTLISQTEGRELVIEGGRR